MLELILSHLACLIIGTGFGIVFAGLNYESWLKKCGIDVDGLEPMHPPTRTVDDHFDTVLKD